MAIRLVPPDYHIEVDSDSDLRTVLRVLGESQGKQSQLDFEADSKPHKSQEIQQPEGFGDMSALFNAIAEYPKQRRVMEVLAASPSGLWAEDITRLSDFESKQSLAGVFSGIYSKIKQFGFERDYVVVRLEHGSAPHTKYHYKFTSRALETWLKAYPLKRSEESPEFSVPRESEPAWSIR